MKTNKIVLGAILSAMLIFNTEAAVSLSRQKVENLNEALEKTNSGWFARENSMTGLSDAELKFRLGAEISPSEFDLVFESPRSLEKSTAEVFDWRNRAGVNWVDPVMNQGSCGSCVSFATVATLQTQFNITSLIPNFNPRYSTEALFACGGGKCATGWRPGAAFDYLKNSGVPDEACAPYTMGATGSTSSCSTVCIDRAARSIKILKATRPTQISKNVEAVREALKRGPLVTTMMVFDDFVAYGGGIYKYKQGKLLGGHAISIVGFDDTQRVWIIRNSWGADWGENGFARISWDDKTGVGLQTWGMELPTPGGYVQALNLEERSYISGKFKVMLESTFLNTQSIELVATKKDDGKKFQISCENVRSCQKELNTHVMEDGQYVFVVRAKISKTHVEESQRFRVFVLNNPAQASLSFSPGDGLDLNKPVNGKISFNVSASSRPVPFESLAFRVMNSAGKIVVNRKTQTDVQNIKMNWRTGAVDDGKYTVWVAGETLTNGKLLSVESSRIAVEVKNK